MTVHVAVVREGTETTKESKTDRGVVKAVETIQPLFAEQHPDDELVQLLEEAVRAAFAEVTQQELGTYYKWTDCPEELPPMKFVCCDRSQLVVNDGGADPILVGVDVVVAA